MVLLDLMGGVALLLWGLHMVHSGIVRAFGANLRRILGRALSNRFNAVLAGIGVTALLQSSTATALMTTSFATSGMVDLVPGLAIMLGANVGTSLIVQVLSFNVSALAPALLVAGVTAFRRGDKTLTRDLGRVAIGLGLMLLSLHILLDSLAPAENAPLAKAFLQAVTGDMLMTVMLGAALTWAAHSSVAVVMLTMSLGYSHFVTPAASIALVLGANLGAAINPLVEGGTRGNPATRRLPMGNLINRVIGCVVVLPIIGPISQHLIMWSPDPSRLAANFHTIFNIVLALLFIGPLPFLATLLERLMPERQAPDDPGTPLYLDPSAVEIPTVALACAAREVMHMGDIVEIMLTKSMTALLTNDRKMVAEVSKMDDAVDSLHKAIKLYVTQITRDSLDESEGRRAMEVIAFSINLEHIGDIIDKNLMELAAKKIRHQAQFSREGAAELEAIHNRMTANLKLSFGIFMTGDVRVARRLLDEKARFREAEYAAAESHITRLRDGKAETIQSSGLHLDVLRDLKRIHSHICAAAYPVLEAAGELHSTRLKSFTPDPVTRDDPVISTTDDSREIPG